MVNTSTLVVLTHDNKIKSSETAYLVKNKSTFFLKWHCEVFDHGTTVTSQTSTTRHTVCGNKSTTCDVALCACPTDINLPKAINSETLAEFRTLVNALTKYDLLEEYDINDGEIIACGVYGLLLNKQFVVDWNILRRCNFTCTYCPPNIHDLVSGFPSMEQYQKEFNEIKIPTNKTVHFVLNGGEPTLHPNILEVVQMCRNVGTVEVLSNGTAPIKMYDTLLDYAKVNISLHHELINEKHMQKFIAIALLDKGSLTFKYFNTFDEEKFGKYLNILRNLNNVGVISNVRLSSREHPGEKGHSSNKLKRWLT